MAGDCQCKRCGSSVSFEECWACGGDGVDGHDCGDDTCFCLRPEENVDCTHCHGTGHFATCLSSEAWCEANPLPGREDVKRGEVEWFEVGT